MTATLDGPKRRKAHGNQPNGHKAQQARVVRTKHKSSLELTTGVVHFDPASVRVPQSKEWPSSKLFGSWPGDETDEEILAYIKEIS